MKLQHAYQISLGTAHRLYTRFAERGEVTPIRPEIQPGMPKLDNLHELYIICVLAENPSLYLKEVCQKIHATTGITVSGSTVSRVLRRNGK